MSQHSPPPRSLDVRERLLFLERARGKPEHAGLATWVSGSLFFSHNHTARVSGYLRYLLFHERWIHRARLIGLFQTHA